MHFALAGVHRRNLCLEIAPVLLRHAHIGQHDIERLLVQFTRFVELRRRHSHALLMHFGEGARQTRGDSAPNIRIVDMTNGITDELAVVKYGFPQM